MSEDLDYALALSLQEQFQTEGEKKERRHNLSNTSQKPTSDDLDCALALSLQQQFENERRDGEQRGRDVGKAETELMPERYDPKLVVDERWELLDPHPDIHDLFVLFDAMFFERRLVNAGVEVRWSHKMTLCAGVCSYEGRGGLCSVRLSVPLLKLRPRKDLVETLLHEMIHALLFVTERNTDHDGHGPNFCAHMKRINSLTGANITIYHSFHQEVRQYRQHWWRCSGPCRNRPPFYGWVKRAMNRAPSPRDRWWADHQMSCGGSYTKVKEPEGYGKKAPAGKKVKVEGNVRNSKKSSSSKDIKEMLTGKGGREGVSGSSKSKGGGSSVGVKIFSGEGHTLDAPVQSRQPASQGERRQRLLEAVERRQQLAQSKGIKRTSTGRTSGDIRDFYTTSPSQKKQKLDNSRSCSGRLADPAASNLPSSGRDIPLWSQNSLTGPSPASTQRETPWDHVVIDSGDDVVVISDDDDDGGGGGEGGEGGGDSGEGGSGESERLLVGMCPVCGRMDIPHDVINSHVTLCLEDDQQEPLY